MSVKGKAAERGPGNFNERVVDEAKKEGVEVKSMSIADREANVVAAHGQGALLPDGDKPKVPQPVRGKLMLCEYIRPHYTKDDDSRFVEMEFSFPLTEKHRGMLPANVEAAWKFLGKKVNTKMLDIDVEEQTVAIHIAPDMAAKLRLDSCPVGKANLAFIEEKGAGAAQNVTRFSFRLICGLTDEIREWADLQYGNSCWISMEATQASLKMD